ncbi:MAG: hypothetical protein F6K56_41100 [Moorea sp. SIO3G5]|nr:hypothetical protein [Moorena sp. SIO3G5]
MESQSLWWTTKMRINDINKRPRKLSQLIKTLCVVVILALGVLGPGEKAYAQEIVVNSDRYCRLTSERNYCEECLVKDSIFSMFYYEPENTETREVHTLVRLKDNTDHRNKANVDYIYYGHDGVGTSPSDNITLNQGEFFGSAVPVTIDYTVFILNNGEDEVVVKAWY